MKAGDIYKNDISSPVIREVLFVSWLNSQMAFVTCLVHFTITNKTMLKSYPKSARQFKHQVKLLTCKPTVNHTPYA